MSEGFLVFRFGEWVQVLGGQGLGFAVLERGIDSG